MPVEPVPSLLIASADPFLLRSLEIALQEFEAHSRVALTAEDALEMLAGQEPPDLFVLDIRLAGGEEDRLTAVIQQRLMLRKIPALLLAEGVPMSWLDALRDGVDVDLIPLSATPDYIRLRITKALTASLGKKAMGLLQEYMNAESDRDPLTGLYGRAGILSRLQTENERAQRSETPLCLILIDIDDFRHWNERLGRAACDELLVQVGARLRAMLRTYDPLGRVGTDEFLALLPGCSNAGAVLLTERIRAGVFTEPFRVSGASVRLSACFAVAESQGRTAAELMRELEEALQHAKDAGPETIECTEGCPEAAPAIFLSPTMRPDLQTW